jgi:hypothetical protein
MFDALHGEIKSKAIEQWKMLESESLSPIAKM